MQKHYERHKKNPKVTIYSCLRIQSLWQCCSNTCKEIKKGQYRTIWTQDQLDMLGPIPQSHRNAQSVYNILFMHTWHLKDINGDKVLMEQEPWNFPLATKQRCNLFHRPLWLFKIKKLFVIIFSKMLDLCICTTCIK